MMATNIRLHAREQRFFVIDEVRQFVTKNWTELLLDIPLEGWHTAPNQVQSQSDFLGRTDFFADRFTIVARQKESEVGARCGTTEQQFSGRGESAPVNGLRVEFCP